MTKINKNKTSAKEIAELLKTEVFRSSCYGYMKIAEILQTRKTNKQVIKLSVIKPSLHTKPHNSQ